LQRFQQAIQSDPNNADGYYNLAATYQQLGKLHQRKTDLAQAESYYHQCLDHNPNHQDCHRGLAVLLVEQARSEDAFKLLEGWAERNPALPGPKIELARLFEESGNREAAKQHLIEAVAVDPTNARALAALGKLREESGDSGQALADYERSLAINRFQPQVASRVTSLRSSLSTAPVVTPPGGTRLVNTPGATLR
jgi:tetratricopeptide (TPR) repeat protein